MSEFLSGIAGDGLSASGGTLSASGGGGGGGGGITGGFSDLFDAGNPDGATPLQSIGTITDIKVGGRNLDGDAGIWIIGTLGTIRLTWGNGGRFFFALE